MTRITGTLEQDERDALRLLAQQERRDPRAQAALRIRQEPEHRGLLRSEESSDCVQPESNEAGESEHTWVGRRSAREPGIDNTLGRCELWRRLMQERCERGWTDRERRTSQRLDYVLWQLETKPLKRWHRWLLRLWKRLLERQIPQ